MTLSDSVLINAGWLFFVALAVVLALVSAAAFGGDLLAWKAQFEATPQPQESAQPAKPKLG